MLSYIIGYNITGGAAEAGGAHAQEGRWQRRGVHGGGDPYICLYIVLYILYINICVYTCICVYI